MVTKQTNTTHAGLSESKRRGIVLSGKKLAEHKGWVQFQDSVMLPVHGLSPELWARCLDAVTEQILHRLADATVERSPSKDPDVADWQVLRTSQGFSLLVECVARRQIDGVHFEMRRFIRRPRTLLYRVGGVGYLLAIPLLLAGAMGFLANPTEWKGTWVVPALITGGALFFVSYCMRDSGGSRGGVSGTSHFPEDPAGGRKPVSPGIDSESRSLLETVKSAIIAVERDRVGGFA